MKLLKLTLALALIHGLCFCKKTVEQPPKEELSACLSEKFEAFKQKNWAESIIRINRPAGVLYILHDAPFDGGEDVLNADCELVCLTDCECDGSIIVLCDETHLNFPWETIWHK